MVTLCQDLVTRALLFSPSPCKLFMSFKIWWKRVFSVKSESQFGNPCTSSIWYNFSNKEKHMILLTQIFQWLPFVHFWSHGKLSGRYVCGLVVLPLLLCYEVFASKVMTRQHKLAKQLRNIQIGKKHLSF